MVISTSEAGTISVGGTTGCGLDSTATLSSSGTHTVTLSASNGEGTYTCTITFTDTAGNAASPLTLTAFTLDTAVSAPSESTAVTTPTNDATPDVGISTSEAGTISVGGTTGCRTGGTQGQTPQCSAAAVPHQIFVLDYRPG